jgi:hypothetical protein
MGKLSNRGLALLCCIVSHVMQIATEGWKGLKVALQVAI